MIQIMYVRTSAEATREANIIANASPALKVGRPHCKGKGTEILQILIQQHTK